MPAGKDLRMVKRSFGSVVAPAGKAGNPVINQEKCSGCSLCISICPLGALELKNKKASPVRWMKMGKSVEISCFACRDCMAICEEGAIRIDGSVVIDRGFYQSVYPSRELRPPEPLGPRKNFADVEDQLSEVEKVIYRRRSNRIFKKEPVPREMIARILEAGRYAPSAGNCQPVRYIVVDDRDLIDEIEKGVGRILKLLSDSYRGNPLGRAFLHLYGLSKPGDVDIRPMYAIAARYREGSKLHLFHHAPCLILALADRRGVCNYALDCGIAVQNIVLAAHSLGLGTCHIGAIKPLNFLPGLKKKLGIGYPYEVVTSFVLGYPRVNQDKAVPREKTPITWFGSGESTK